MMLIFVGVFEGASTFFDPFLPSGKKSLGPLEIAYYVFCSHKKITFCIFFFRVHSFMLPSSKPARPLSIREREILTVKPACSCLE
jgi:hypothetical protein